MFMGSWSFFFVVVVTVTIYLERIRPIKLIKQNKTKTIQGLDSGFAVDSDFQLLDSISSLSLELGFQILILRGIPDSLNRVPEF